MIRFALVGNGPITNRGCEAIVLGTKKIVEREFGPADFLLASFAQDPKADLPHNIHPLQLNNQRPRWSYAWWEYQLGKRLHRTGYTRRFLKPLESRLTGVEAALSIGGDGYAIDYGHGIVDNLVVMDSYLKSRGIPVIVWGASIGPFSQEPDFERRMAQHFSGLDLVVVREPVSLAYLKSLGVTSNVYLAPDPAFALDTAPYKLPEKVESLLQQPCLGVNLSPLLARYATQGDIAQWTVLAAAILERLIVSLGLSILLVPHVISQDGDIRMDDDIFLQNVRRTLSVPLQGQTAIAPRNLNCENLKWIIGRTTAFVGARTHSTIAALSSRVPCLSIAYSRKAWGINELVFGHRDWVFSSTELHAEQLCERVGNLVQHRQDIRAHLNDVIPGLIDKTYDAAKLLYGVMPEQQGSQRNVVP